MHKLTKNISIDITNIIVGALDDLKTHNLEDGAFQIRQEVASVIATSLSDVPIVDISIEARWGGSDHPMDDGGYRFYLTAEVPKSEEELQADRADQARAEAWELEEFNRLKAKFEGKADGS